jgi:hypothetical protein
MFALAVLATRNRRRSEEYAAFQRFIFSSNQSGVFWRINLLAVNSRHFYQLFLPVIMPRGGGEKPDISPH